VFVNVPAMVALVSLAGAPLIWTYSGVPPESRSTQSPLASSVVNNVPVPVRVEAPDVPSSVPVPVKAVAEVLLISALYAPPCQEASPAATSS
jgi:hypothetical protein